MNGITVFQQGVYPDAGYIGCIDTQLVQSGPNGNAGAVDELAIRVRPASYDLRTLLRFDVSSLPSNVTIESAILTLTCYRTASDMSVGVFKGLVPWIEGTGNYSPAGAGEPCWTFREYNTVAWGADGGLAGTDFEAVAEDSKALPSQAAYTLDITDMAAAWVADPTVNFGLWLLQVGASTTEYASFRSRHYATASSRPKLTIAWNAPGNLGPVPCIEF